MSKEDSQLQQAGTTRSGEVRRGLHRRHYSTVKELKQAHKRVYGAPTLYVVGKMCGFGGAAAGRVKSLKLAHRKTGNRQAAGTVGGRTAHSRESSQHLFRFEQVVC